MKTHLTLVWLWFGHVVNVIILYLLVMNYCIDALVFFCCMQYLNTNHTLYDAVRKAEQEKHLLTEEAQRAAHFLRVDFERGGIHLSAGMFFFFKLLISIAITVSIFFF